MTDQTITDLTDAERVWISTQLQAASTLATLHTGRDQGLPSLSSLGETFRVWSEASPSERADANSVVLALGTAFGQHLVDGLGLRWVIVTDEHGTDLAVHGQPGDMLMFPISSTTKRYEQKEYDFFTWLYERIRDDVQKRRRAP